eukprot:6953742-Alexandrium_andersonii.AAC.1
MSTTAESPVGLRMKGLLKSPLSEPISSWPAGNDASGMFSTAHDASPPPPGATLATASLAANFAEALASAWDAALAF